MDFDLPSLETYLSGFPNFERRPSKNMLNLQTMSTLCTYFGHPEMSYRTFHVAGSKGKGTISANIAAILRQNGYKTGVYSSPHVYHFTERVGTGAGAFPLEIYTAAEKELKAGIADLVKSGQLAEDTITWYELATIFAMLVFRLAKVDYAIFEVGLGGRLDATNVIMPVAVAMGPIELEHTEFLGDTLAKIATEKAGTFKDGVPVISAPQAPEVKEVFENIAIKNHTYVHYITNTNNYQEVDAEVAVEAVKIIIKDLDEPSALATVRNIHLPGRFEIIDNPRPGLPYLLLDGAHTENSVREILNRLKNEHRHGYLLFACAADKNVEKMAVEIKNAELFDRIFLTIPGEFKKSDLPRANQAFSSLKNVYSSPDYRSEIELALASAAADKVPLIVFGSFYLLAEVKKCML